MTLMIIFLLAMNLVLAAGMGLLWVRSHTWCEKSMDMEKRLQERFMDMESRLTGLEITDEERSPVSNQEEFWIKSRIQAREGTQIVPERYKLAASMASTGMDLEEVSEALGISVHEARQLSSLADLARRGNSENDCEAAIPKEYESG